MIEKIEYGTKDLGMILHTEKPNGLLSGETREPWLRLDACDVEAEGLEALVAHAFHGQSFSPITVHYDRPARHYVAILSDTIRVYPVPLPSDDHVPHIVIKVSLHKAKITWAVGGDVTHCFTLPSAHSSYWT